MCLLCRDSLLKFANVLAAFVVARATVFCAAEASAKLREMS